MSIEYKYTAAGHKVRIIGQVNGDFVGYMQMEYLYGDEDAEGDGELVLLTPSEAYDEPPTAVLNERICQLREIAEMMDEAIASNRRTLAEQERERNNHNRWRKDNRAWLDVEGVTTGKLTHRAEFSELGMWKITDLRPKHGYSMESIILHAKRHDDGWEWYWTAPKNSNYREKTQLFEGEAAAKAWVESQLAELPLKRIDLRMGMEIMAKAKSDGIRCPSHIIEFIESERAEKRKAEAEELKQRLAQLEQL